MHWVVYKIEGIDDKFFCFCYHYFGCRLTMLRHCLNTPIILIIIRRQQQDFKNDSTS
jgi:hypothetical protein